MQMCHQLVDRWERSRHTTETKTCTVPFAERNDSIQIPFIQKKSFRTFMICCFSVFVQPQSTAYVARSVERHNGTMATATATTATETENWYGEKQKTSLKYVRLNRMETKRCDAANKHNIIHSAEIRIPYNGQRHGELCLDSFIFYLQIIFFPLLSIRSLSLSPLFFRFGYFRSIHHVFRLVHPSSACLAHLWRYGRSFLWRTRSG